MGIVINTLGTMDDESHLTLLHPVGTMLHGTLEVQIRVAEAAPHPSGVYPEGWLGKSPQERAESFAEWIEGLPKPSSEGGLSDYAVSRDSIYE